MAKEWKKTLFEKELEKLRVKGLAEKRERELSRTKFKATTIGTLKYRKTAALKKGGRTVGRGLKKVSAEAKKRRISRASISKPKKQGKTEYQKWQERIRKTYKF